MEAFSSLCPLKACVCVLLLEEQVMHCRTRPCNPSIERATRVSAAIAESVQAHNGVDAFTRRSGLASATGAQAHTYTASVLMTIKGKTGAPLT